jgi:hypothetical protein
MSKLKPGEAKILVETITTVCEPLSKEELIPAIFATFANYCEEMDWTLDESLAFVAETFGWLNRLKISGTPILSSFAIRYRRMIQK